MITVLTQKSVNEKERITPNFHQKNETLRGTFYTTYYMSTRLFSYLLLLIRLVILLIIDVSVSLNCVLYQSTAQRRLFIPIISINRHINQSLPPRKLKNRMSAQQARDRKKLFVSELEERVAQLEKEVRYLLPISVSSANTCTLVTLGCFRITSYEGYAACS